MWVQANSVDVDAMAAALREAPALVNARVKRQLMTEGRRFKKNFIRDRMSGPPGINWDQRYVKPGKNIQLQVTGDNLVDLTMKAKASRFLAQQETAHTVTAKGGGWLFIKVPRDKLRNADGRKLKFYRNRLKREFAIVAKVKSIRFGGKLGYKKYFNAMVPSMVANLQTALVGATQAAMERRIKHAAQVFARI